MILHITRSRDELATHESMDAFTESEFALPDPFSESPSRKRHRPMPVSELSPKQLPDPFAEYQCTSETNTPKSRYRPRIKRATDVSECMRVLVYEMMLVLVHHSILMPNIVVHVGFCCCCCCWRGGGGGGGIHQHFTYHLFNCSMYVHAGMYSVPA